VLRPILIDGDFRRKENRVEFAESYNTIIKLDDDIRKLEFDLSPEGDIGKKYAAARDEMTSLPVKRRKVQLILEDVSLRAKGLIDAVRKALKSLASLLEGINGTDTSGKYEKLTNLEKVAGRGSSGSQFLSGVGNTSLKLKDAVKIMESIDGIG
jgi:hypothetical protein